MTHMMKRTTILVDSDLLERSIASRLVWA